MINKIAEFLMNVSLKNSEHKVRKMVADHFEGTTTSNCRYVKIGDEEFKINKNPDNLKNGGWDIEKMDWEQGDDWRFFKPY